MTVLRKTVSLVRPALLALLAGTLFAASALANNPVPTINQPLSPGQIFKGSSAFTLTVNGTNFVSGATVLWNGSPRTTTFVSGSQLTAAILTPDIANFGTALVTVQNPAPGGGISNTDFFQIGGAFVVSYLRSDITVGNGPETAQPGDFNGDGKADMIVLNSPDNTMTFLAGNGDGTFKPGVNYAVPGFPVASVCADFNHDGKMDVVTVDQHLSNISVLLGNGDGTFKTHVEYAVGANPYSAVFGDFNADGNLDVAVSNRSGNTVSVLIGNGDGTFQPQVTYTTGNSPQAITVGDFNGDGKLDLATANNGSNTVSILLGNGNGTFAANVDYATALSPTYLQAADFNKDGKLDIITSTASANASLLLGNGDGTFQAHKDSPIGNNSQIVNVGDFNNDGKFDYVTADYFDNTFSILDGNGDGTFNGRIAVPVGAAPDWIGVGDLNADGKLDLVSANSSTNTITVLTASTITMTPSLLTFGSISAGTKSTVKTVTVKNTGTASATLGAVTFNGANASYYTQTNTCSTTLAAGASCVISITFSPLVSGSLDTALAVGVGTTGQVVNSYVKGSGVIQITLNPRVYSFANTVIGKSSSAGVFTFTNASGVPFHINSIVLTGVNQNEFSYTTDCPIAPATLSPAVACHVNVTFTPSDSGNRTVTLVFNGDFTLLKQGSLLHGMGIAAQVSTSTLNFGTVTLGSSSVLPVTLTNLSPSTPLVISSLAKTGNNPGDYTQTNNCVGTLAPLATCTVTMTFKPAATGTRTATLMFNDNDISSPQNVALTGVGQ